MIYDLDETIQFVEKPSSELYSIKVVQGPYLGVIYTYGKVSLHEDEAAAELRLSFSFNIEKVPDNLDEEELKQSLDFKNFMGDILSQLLEDKLDNDESAKDNT
jgi:hypothetical protein